MDHTMRSALSWIQTNWKTDFSMYLCAGWFLALFSAICAAKASALEAPSTVVSVADVARSKKSSEAPGGAPAAPDALSAPSDKVPVAIHDLLVQAIHEGEAEGLLTGEMSDHFTREFRSRGRLVASARVIGDSAKPTCKRLAVVFTKSDVLTPAGLTDGVLRGEMNYCVDGSPWGE